MADPLDLPHELRQARRALEPVAEGDLGRWLALFHDLGRAAQAAEAGDAGQVVTRLNAAANREYDLCGDCDRTGAILDRIREEEEEGT